MGLCQVEISLNKKKYWDSQCNVFFSRYFTEGEYDDLARKITTTYPYLVRDIGLTQQEAIVSAV